MNEKVSELTQIVGIEKKYNKPKVKHHLNGRNFPFYTRNPERVKFKDDFNEIIGIITRISLGKAGIIENIKDIHLENVLKKIEKSEQVTPNEVRSIFSIDFEILQTPVLFQYYPVDRSTKTARSESKGKELLANYIVKLLRLDENEEWKRYVSHYDAKNLFEQVYIDSFPELTESTYRHEEFNFFDQDELVKSFEKDLHNLMKNETYFIKNLHLLISYYYFYYVVRQVYLLNAKKRKNENMWFAYEKEKVSTSRNAVKKGYKIFNEASKNLLEKNDLLDYLNKLSEKDTYRSLEELLNDENELPVLRDNIKKFNYIFSEALKRDYKPDFSIDVQLTQLLSYLKEHISNETSSRYRKSFDEFSRLGLIKSRGRLGYVFNATQEMILVLVAVIIGSEEKVLLKTVFFELEKRGMYFDKQSKNKIVKFFEDINILEKLSDSGDAQYVKSIL